MNTLHHELFVLLDPMGTGLKSHRYCVLSVAVNVVSGESSYRFFYTTETGLKRAQDAGIPIVERDAAPHLYKAVADETHRRTEEAMKGAFGPVKGYSGGGKLQ